MGRALLIIVGLLLAGLGGAMAYRAAFRAPHTAVVVTETGVSEVPDLWRIAGGLGLLIGGALVAFFAARRRP